MRSFVFRTLAKALVGILAGLFVVDRWVGLRDAGEAEADGALFVRDGELGWVNRPEFRGDGQALDSLGLRNPEVPADASADEVRILVVGASNTYGLGVNEGETWRDYLEPELAAETGGKVRVLNAAVQGYSIVQECRRARRLVPLLQPDLVVVFVYPGRQSLLDHSPADAWVMVGDEMVPASMVRSWPEALHWLPAAAHGLLSHSNLYVRHRTMTRLGGKEGEQTLQFVLSRAPRTEDTQARLDRSLEELQQLSDYIRDKDVELRLVLMLQTFGGNDKSWQRYLRQNRGRGAPPPGTPRREPIEAMAEWLAPTGAEVWDFYDVISSIGRDRKKYIIDRNQHWSPAGHWLVAMALKQHLKSSGLLQRLTDRRRRLPRTSEERR